MFSQELKGKILLKGKKMGELEECSDVDNLESSDVSDDDKAEDLDNQATESTVGKSAHCHCEVLVCSHFIWI